MRVKRRTPTAGANQGAGACVTCRAASIPGRVNTLVRNSSVNACKDFASSSVNGSSSWAASLPSSRMVCVQSFKSWVMA